MTVDERIEQEASRWLAARDARKPSVEDETAFSYWLDADIRNYCEKARGEFLRLSFELAMAAEVLQAVLKEVPDPDGRPFGARARARRVARHLKRTATDARDAAKNAARTYAAFQREFDPELSATARTRPASRARRRFDFGA